MIPDDSVLTVENASHLNVFLEFIFKILFKRFWIKHNAVDATDYL